METHCRNNQRNWFGIIQGIFWVAFIIIPLVTGLLSYHWLPNESPLLSSGEVVPPNEVISSHEECLTDSSCETVADVWRDTITGKTYTHDDFISHKSNERNRMALAWFCYGLIACFFIAGVAHYKKKEFINSFGVAIFVNIAIALYIYFSF